MPFPPLSRFGRHGRLAELLNVDSSQPIRLDLGVAGGFRLRLLGLMGQAVLQLAPVPQALLLLHCRCVHTGFMRAPIDIAFLDAGYEVLDVHAMVNPWRVRWSSAREACHTLELPPGAVLDWRLMPGSRLLFPDQSRGSLGLRMLPKGLT